MNQKDMLIDFVALHGKKGCYLIDMMNYLRKVYSKTNTFTYDWIQDLKKGSDRIYVKPDGRYGAVRNNKKVS